jgi:organic hydroperoxide reductase OsmC/OhrA
MSTHTIELSWTRTTPDFSYDTYNRDHQIYVGGKQVIANSAAVEYLGSADKTNPEELLAAALSSCHMLTFLAIAAKSGHIIDSYKARATAILGKNTEGRLAVTEIDLYPEIIFTGEKIPNSEQLISLHDKAHRNCFIAQSLKTKVNIR